MSLQGPAGIAGGAGVSVDDPFYYDWRKQDYRLHDLRGSRVLELRDNTYGHRAWSDSACGFHDTQEHPIPPRMNANDFIKKWTGNNQRFGWPHKRDLGYRPRPASLPPADDSGKTINYSPYAYQNRIQMQNEDVPLPHFPPPECWKVNKYGNQIPSRIGGGISNWLPSHTEILWDYTKKWNKDGENYRVLNPVPTRGVLQARVKL